MKENDVIGIGNALLDFTVEVDDSMLVELNFKKGQMYLVDEEKSKKLLDRLKSHDMKTSPGGSSANTLAGVANFGGKTILLGKVGSDSHGDIYIHESENAGIKSKLKKHEKMTGHAITFITTDHERTFAVNLGAALEFKKDDIIDEDIIKSKILHIEGYQLEDPNLKEASLHAMKVANSNDVLVSIDLSDPGLVSRNKETLLDIVKKHVDIVFVNEDEAKEFTGASEKEALEIISKMCKIAVVKLGENGSLIKKDGKIYTIPAYKTKVVNTNGAGDMYAAGILYGVSYNLSIEDSARIGSYAASLVVSQVEARLNDKLDINKLP